MVIPKAHYGPIQSLNESNIEMIKQMDAIGMKIFEEETEFDKNSDLLSGFHWPFCAVQHLHLHLIAPKQEMNCFKRLEFHSIDFGSVDQAIEKLEKIPAPDESQNS